jgi:hypothetical protein
MARAKASLWSRSLDKLKGAFVHAEPEPAPRPAKKKPAAVAKSADPAAVAGTSDPAAVPEAEKTPKKKIPAQPWYRHRQRW